MKLITPSWRRYSSMFTHALQTVPPAFRWNVLSVSLCQVGDNRRDLSGRKLFPQTRTQLGDHAGGGM